MPNILSITYYPLLPYFSGGQKTVIQFSSFLGKKTKLYVAGTQNNEVSLAENYEILPVMRNSALRYIDITMIFTLKKIIKEKNIDCLLLEHTHLGWMGIILKWIFKKPLLIHSHNIEYMRYKLIGRWWWWIMKWYEIWVLKMADTIFCISEEDMQFMIKRIGINAKKCVLAPFGVPHYQLPTDKSACRKYIAEKHHINPEHKIILFGGWLAYEPNEEALGIIVHHINRLLQKEQLAYTILICGKDLPEKYQGFKNEANIVYAGFVPDIETYFKGADMFINPILVGGGVKTKLLEAIAFNTTSVSTQSGAIGCDKSICENKLLTVNDYDWVAFVKTMVEHWNKKFDTPYEFYTKHYWGHIISRIYQYFDGQKVH